MTTAISTTDVSARPEERPDPLEAAREAVAAVHGGTRPEEALRDTGLLDLSAPWRPPVSPETLLSVGEELGHGDGALGRVFVAAQAAAVLHWAAPSPEGKLGKGSHVTGADEDSGVLTDDGSGAVLTGRWREVVGATTADWLVLPCRSGPRRVFALVPTTAVRRGHGVAGLLDDLAAPEVVCDGVPVAPERIVDASGPPSRGSRILPFPLHLRHIASGVALGIARRAVGEFVRTARHRSRAGAVQRMIEQPVLQRELTHAVQSFRAARELLDAETRRLTSGSPQAGALTRGGRVRLASAQLHAQRCALAAVRLVFSKAGGSALYSGHPLERAWRESETLSTHPLFGPEAERELARAQFGGYPSGAML